MCKSAGTNSVYMLFLLVAIGVCVGFVICIASESSVTSLLCMVLYPGVFTRTVLALLRFLILGEYLY